MVISSLEILVHLHIERVPAGVVTGNITHSKEFAENKEKHQN